MSPLAKPMIILMADDDADDRLLAQDAMAEARVNGELRFVENGEELLDYLFRRSRYATADATSVGCAGRPMLTARPADIFPSSSSTSGGVHVGSRNPLREMKANPDLRRIPVVVLTTSKAESDISQIYDLGANSFISKPVSFESLVNVMKTIGHYWLETVELPVST